MSTSMVYAGQGPITIGDWDATLKTLKNQRQVSVASRVLKLSLERNTETIKESISGSRLDYLEYETGKSGTIEMEIQEFDADMLAQAFYSTATAVTGATVSTEEAPTVAAGDLYHTQHPKISALVITDSTDVTPVTLTENTHYRVDDADYGRIKFLDVAGLTQPLHLAYTYAARTQIKPFTATNVIKGVIFDGVSTADGSKSRVMLPRISFSPIADFDFINETAASLKLTGKMLLADVAANDPILGKFGTIDVL
jgi:hypothetical protein